MSFGFSVSDLMAASRLAVTVYSALKSVDDSRTRVDELKPFLIDTGCGRELLNTTFLNPEIQAYQVLNYDRAKGLTPSTILLTPTGARTKLNQTSVHLQELRKIAENLDSLQNTLLCIKSALDSQLGGKNIEDMRLGYDLEMIVCCCDEFCARADKLMGRTRGRCGENGAKFLAVEWLDSRGGTPRWLKIFSCIHSPLQAITSKLSQGETPHLAEAVAIEKQASALDLSGLDLERRAISVRDWGRALPYEDLPHVIYDLSNGLCFLFATLICPPLTWLSLRSLDLELASALDQNILTYSPLTVTFITILGHHRSLALITVAASIIASTGAIALPVWKSCARGRLSAFMSCWMSIVVGCLVWSHTGGSNPAFFLVFMPFALGLGVALGLVWHKRMTHWS